MSDKKNKHSKQNQQNQQQQSETSNSEQVNVSESDQKGFCLDGLNEQELKEKAMCIIDALTKENENLIAEQETLKKQISKGDEYLNQLVMLKNDFENHKRRNAGIAETKTEEGKLFVIEKLLPILDTFDKARQMLSAQEMATFDLIVRQFEKILSEVGVEKMDLLGQKFDPNTANAIHKQSVTDAESDDAILEIYANGYRFGEKILRYATVCVGVYDAPSDKENIN